MGTQPTRAGDYGYAATGVGACGVAALLHRDRSVSCVVIASPPYDAQGRAPGPGGPRDRRANANNYTTKIWFCVLFIPKRQKLF